MSCLCVEGFMVRKWTGNATKSRNAGRLPVRACCKLHPADTAVKCCGLFFSPDAQYDGQHENDMGQYRTRVGEILRCITVLGSKHRLRS